MIVYFRVPSPREDRPARGKLPIQLNYRTWFGPRRTKWVALDVDDEQLRYFFSMMWSGGWNSLARFEGDDRMSMIAPNEGCIRWRYGFDGASPSSEVPEGAQAVSVPPAVKSVTWQLVLCKIRRSCTVTFFRDRRDPQRSCD